MKNKAPTKKTSKAKNIEKPSFFLCLLEILTLKISLEIAIFTTKSYQLNCLDSINEFKYLLAQFSSLLDTIFLGDFSVGPARYFYRILVGPSLPKVIIFDDFW